MLLITISREDWEIESAVMSDIYANSYLTIAASLSSSDNSGFLGPRKSHIAKVLKFELRGVVTEIYVREQVLHEDSEMSACNPLFTRAWAFQELLISPRLLSFNLAEVQWHCKRASWCECDHWRNLSPKLDSSILRQRRHFVQNSEACTYNRWYTIVEAYSQLNLTVSSDRLPALSALARQFRATLNDTYLAGIWKGDLGPGLGWQSSWDPPGIGTLPDRYRAPSWCWSSIDGKVFYGTPSNKEKSWEYGNKNYKEKFTTPVTALGVQCTLSGTNAFGEVHDGFLKVFRRFTSAILEVPEVPKHADEARIPYSIWPESGTKIAPQVQWPPVSYACFRPDVPLIQSAYKDASGLVKQTVARSTLKPGQRRKPISGAQVWVVDISHYSLVVCRSSRVSGAYERIGILTNSEKIWEGEKGSSECREISIV
jgi:hypothetical protein